MTFRPWPSSCVCQWVRGAGSKNDVDKGEIEVLVEEVEVDGAGERGVGVGGNDCGGHFIVDLVWLF